MNEGGGTGASSELDSAAAEEGGTAPARESTAGAAWLGSLAPLERQASSKLQTASIEKRLNDITLGR